MGVSSRRLSSTEMASGFTVCKSLELLVLLLAAQTVPGHCKFTYGHRKLCVYIIIPPLNSRRGQSIS